MGLFGSSAIVETAIGLVLVWFLAAGLSSAVVEAVANVFAFRAKHLWRSVDRWFASATATDGGAARQTSAGKAVALAGRMPDRPTPQAGTGASAQDRFLLAVPGLDVSKQGLRRTKTLPRDAAVAALAAASTATAPPPPPRRRRFRRSPATPPPAPGLAADFADTQLGNMVAKLPAEIRDDVTARVAWMGAWFDGEMERLSTSYRTRVRWWTAAAALVVTLGIGLDSVHIASQLYREPTRRSMLVAEAEAQVAEGQQLCAPATTTTAPGTTTTTTAPSASEDGPVPAIDVSCPQRIADDLEVLDVARPVWSSGAAWWSGAGVLYVTGLLASFTALVAGGPFWFQILQRLIGLRRSGSGSPAPSAPTSPPS